MTTRNGSIAYAVAFMGALALTAFATYCCDFATRIPTVVWVFILLVKAFSVVLVFTCGTAIFFRTTRTRKLMDRPAGRWAAITVYYVFAFFMLSEGVLTFVPRSDGGNHSLLSRNWFGYFWRVNSLGFRDREFREAAKDAAKRIYVVGDSFAAGHGIRNPAERFPDLLDARVREQGARVFNLGKIGADTKSELQLLRSVPRPDTVILQYLGNDIEGTAIGHGLTCPAVAQPFFIRLSSVLNFVYFRFSAYNSVRAEYETFLKAALNTEAVRAEHIRDLESFIKLCTQARVPLVVVLFPFLGRGDIEPSAIYVRPIKQFFTGNRVPVVDVTELIRDLRPEEIVVNGQDSHPSAKLHALVADALYSTLVSNGLLRASEATP